MAEFLSKKNGRKWVSRSKNMGAKRRTRLDDSDSFHEKSVRRITNLLMPLRVFLSIQNRLDATQSGSVAVGSEFHFFQFFSLPRHEMMVRVKDSSSHHHHLLYFSSEDPSSRFHFLFPSVLLKKVDFLRLKFSLIFAGLHHTTRRLFCSGRF